MGYPTTYYVMPEHHTRLSDDRSELVFEQHLPGVSKEDLNVEVLEESVCMDFKPEGKETVSRCYSLPYLVDPSTARGGIQGQHSHFAYEAAGAHAYGQEG